MGCPCLNPQISLHAPCLYQSWTWIGFIHGLDWIGLGQKYSLINL